MKNKYVKMQNIAAILVILLVGAHGLAQPSSGKARAAVELGKPNYTITLTPPSGPLSLQSPLLVEMYYTNITSADIYMTADICSICTGQRILVTRAGKEVETTKFERRSTGRPLPSDPDIFPPVHANTRSFRYPPGIFWKVDLDLRKFYVITEPGQYTVTVSRTEDTKDGKITVSSNSVTLDIVP